MKHHSQTTIIQLLDSTDIHVGEQDKDILYGVVTAAKSEELPSDESHTLTEVEFDSFSPSSLESAEACAPSKSLRARIISNAITHRYRAGSQNAMRKVERLVSNLFAFLPDTLKASSSSKRSAIYNLTDTKAAMKPVTKLRGFGVITPRVA